MDLSEIATVADLGDAQVRAQPVLLRASFDAFDDSGSIKDGLRIESAEATIRMLKEKGAQRIIVLSYAGRPERTPAKKLKTGENARYNGVLYDLRLSLRPAADFLHGMLKEKVHFISALREDGSFREDARDYLGHAATYLNGKLRSGDVVLLDNLRFWDGENNGDKDSGREFAQLVASLGSVYVQDGFAQAHRINNATVGEITRHVRCSVLGLQFRKEIAYLRGIFDNLSARDRGPFVFILGGKKIETKPGIVSKISVAEKLMDAMQSHDKIFVGGAMAYPFLIAERYRNEIQAGRDELMRVATAKEMKGIVGDSHVEWDQIHDQAMLAAAMVRRAAERGISVRLPTDHGVFSLGSKSITVSYVDRIFEEMVAGDIGPMTVASWKSGMADAHTIVLAGPVGWYENELFAKGSIEIVREMAQQTATNHTLSIAAGGDTAEMVRSFGYGNALSLVSIGGGATLEFLQNGALPALSLMSRKDAVATVIA